MEEGSQKMVYLLTSSPSLVLWTKVSHLLVLYSFSGLRVTNAHVTCHVTLAVTHSQLHLCLSESLLIPLLCLNSF